MLILAGKVTMTDLLMMFPAAIFGWFLSALALDRFYLKKLDVNTLLKANTAQESIKPGGISRTLVCAIAIIGAVVLNRVLHVDIEFALGSGLGLVVIYIWALRLKCFGSFGLWYMQFEVLDWG
jgi:hypothetical protein